jgi:pimeloyl-ACP methyl ester carboxylesterase
VLGIYLVKNHPEDYYAFVGVGQTVSVGENEQYSYDWILQQATARSDLEAQNLLTAVGRPGRDGQYPGEVPVAYADVYDAGSDVTSAYVGRYGGDVYGETGADKIDDVIFGTGVYDKESWSDAWLFSQGIFDDPKVMAFDFKDASQGFQNFAVPLYFFMGQHDYDTPVNLFEEYYSRITSTKTYVRFTNSAHFPFYEERTKFREELLNAKRATLGS